MIVGCHGGTPVTDVGQDGGADHTMVYDLIREGARAFIGASGYSYGSPSNLHGNLWGERLIQRFFEDLLAPGGSNSLAIGRALAKAKGEYTFGFGTNDALDRKTVTEFNLFGVPWAFLLYPGAAGAAEAEALAPPQAAFRVAAQPPSAAAEPGVYTSVFQVDVERYDVQVEEQGGIEYDLLSIPGGDTAVEPGAPVLPFLAGPSLPLPASARVLSVRVLRSDAQEIGRFNIPIATVAPWTEGGLSYTTETDLAGLFPADEELVRFQRVGDETRFSVFPVQHDPSTDETVFHRSLWIEVVYEAPPSLSVAGFETDKMRYGPSEPGTARATIGNVGADDATLLARLEIVAASGKRVAEETSDAFVVPAGGTCGLKLAWTAPEAHGTYAAELALYEGRSLVGAAAQQFVVVGGEITQVDVPPRLHVGERGTFRVTFANYGPQSVEGEARLVIQDGEEGFRAELVPRRIVAKPGAQAVATFEWTPTQGNGGRYAAAAGVVVDSQSDGPVAANFDVVADVCEGDFNGDGDVDRDDLAAAVELGRTRCAGECRADLDRDDDVDGRDLHEVVEDFPRTDCPGF
ncbi:MAG: hypothetical protein Kow0092_36650 [Deferrisomatales bacterium]